MAAWTCFFRKGVQWSQGHGTMAFFPEEVVIMKRRCRHGPSSKRVLCWQAHAGVGVC